MVLTESCLCLSGVARFVATDPVAQFAVEYAENLESSDAAKQMVIDSVTHLVRKKRHNGLTLKHLPDRVLS
jgi:RecA/RadA recombinase